MKTLLEALAVAGGLVPLAAMLVSLFAAVWIREGRGREREPVVARSRPDSR